MPQNPQTLVLQTLDLKPFCACSGPGPLAQAVGIQGVKDFLGFMGFKASKVSKGRRGLGFRV